MYSLIIADDEEIERKAFRLLIEKNFPRVIVIEDAVNGIDFIEKVLRLKPDIAIVDINMPGLNGLEAVRMLKDKGITSKIIIHTAYSQYEYAQDAVYLGAFSYILKPIKREKIISTINNCLSRIDEERKKQVEHDRFKKVMDELMPIIETDFMSSILLGDIDWDRLHMYMDIIGIKFISGYIMTIHFPAKETSFLNNNEVEKNLLKNKILDLIRREIKNICSCIIGPVINNEGSLFIPVDDCLTKHSFKIWSIGLAELLRERVEKELSVRLHIGIGQLYSDIERLTSSYKESINALMDKTVTGSVRYVGDVSASNDYQNSFLKYENEFLKLVATCDFEACKDLIGRMFKDMAKNYEIDFVKYLILEFMAYIQRYLSENNILLTSDFWPIKKSFNEVIKLGSFSELKYWMESFIGDVIDKIGSGKRTKVNNLVKQAIEYIKANYTRDISLENVSENIGISSYYLSRLFKQELNRNFIEYLTEVRIKQSISLLKGRDYSVKELSECVGYINPTYFCKVFKKYTGKTIGEFKILNENRM